MKKKIDLLESIKVLITPWEKGFSCAILQENKCYMNHEEYELCSTIARGMIKMGMDSPEKVFQAGVQGFAEDRRKKKEKKVIDFREHLKKKFN
jgi:hypothetical protein